MSDKVELSVENEDLRSEESNPESDGESDQGSGSGSDSDYDIIDVTDDPLYQVLSAFFETEEGENLCDILKDLSSAVRENTKMMSKLLQSKKQ